MATAPESNWLRSIHGSAEPTDRVDHDRERARVPHDRIEQMADILAPRHERMLTAVTLDDNLAEKLADDSDELDDLLVAEIEGLDACLRRVERARRESIVSSAQFGPPVDDENDEAFGVWEGTADGMPRRMGRFEIECELGRGGLGVVLLAYDPVLKRRVALKIPRAEALITAELRQRFQREAQAAARLTHPHIVPVHEVGEVGPICFIAAAYIRGQSLSEWLRTAAGPMTPRAAAELVAELAEAMHYAHGQGVLHRDLKPGNILLEPCVAADGSSDASHGSPRSVPKITDFGLAKLMDLAGDETRTGVILGTPAYMSPEQATGGKLKLGPESDVYSLGAILYELLTGKPPFRGDSDTETLMQVAGSLPIAPRRVQAAIPTDLEAICLHCLEKLPAQRYRTAGALAGDLRRFLAGEPTLVQPLSVAQRLRRWARRRPEYAALAGLGLAALVTIAAGMVYHTRQLNQAVDLANHHAVLAEGNRQLALKHEGRANEQLYVAHMRLADRAIYDGDLPTARRLIDEYGPGKDLCRLRGIEWHLLREEVERAGNTGDNLSTTIFEHPANVDAVQFTPDGRWLLSGCEDGHLRIWKAEDRELLWDIPAHGSCINQVRVSPDGRRIMTASCDSTLGIWQVDSSGPPVPIHRLPHGTPVRQVAFSPDGRQFASQCDGRQVAPGIVHGALYVWDVESGERVHFAEFPAPMGAKGLEWSPDGRYLVILRDWLVTAFRTADWSPQYSKYFPDHSKREWVRRIAYRPISGEFTMCSQNSLRQIDFDTGVESTLLDTLNAGEFAWSADGRFVATSDRDREGMIHLFDGWNAFRPHAFDQHHTGRVAEIAFSPDGLQLATASFDGRACLTDLSTRLGHKAALRRPLPFEGETVHGYDACAEHLTWLRDGEFRRMELNRASTASGSDAESLQDDGSLVTSQKLLDVPLLRDAAVLPYISAGILSAGGKRATWMKERQVTVADLEAGKQVDLPPEVTASTVVALVFDQRPIAFLRNDYTVGVFDLETQKLIFTEQIDAYPNQDMTAELSPDGRFLLILNTPTSVRLVDLTAARCRLVSKENWWNTTAPTFSPDNRYFSVIINETVVGVWETQSLELKHFLRPRQRPLLAAFSPDSRTLAIASEHKLTFWNNAEGQEMVSLPIPAKPVRVQFSPDGKKLSCITENSGNVEIYEWSVVDE